jgi:hypothetical protein
VDFGCFGCSDFAWLPLKQPTGFVPSAEGADEWGCVWDHTDVRNMGQVKGHPLKDLDSLDAVARPDYDDDSRYVDVMAMLERARPRGTYIVGGIFMVLFERMHSLHGFENVLVGLMTEPDAMGALADLVLDVQRRVRVQRLRGQRGDRGEGSVHQTPHVRPLFCCQRAAVR